jgi:LAO/AO transport system kinase
VVLSAPGLGDDIQAIKAGILEIADIHAVSKADKPEAAATVSALKGMMALGTSKARSTWTSPVLSVSATRNEGVQDLMDAIGGHWAHLTTTGELAQRQRNIVKTRVLASARHIFQKRFNSGIGELEEHLHAVAKREIDPSAVAQLLLGWNEKALAK